MFASPDLMPSFSRVWIYQSDRPLSTDEEIKIASSAKEFIETWTAHNQELKASFEIKYKIFLIFMIDEEFALASGCSIDKSTHFIQKIEKEYLLSLLDRQIFAYKKNDKIFLVRKKEFESLISNGSINDETIVYNNLVSTKKEFEEKWEVSLKDSWHKSIFA